MTYETAIKTAWNELGRIFRGENYEVSLLSDTYCVNLKDRLIVSNSCNIPVKEYLAILLLHYLIGLLKNGYSPSNEWISFKEIDGGEAYYSAFYKSVIGPLLHKYGRSPENLLGALLRFKGEKLGVGDVAIELITFRDVKVRIILWRADSEFGPEATILFDRNLTKIYSMEDIVVFSHFIISSL